jgi:hypothetical protein
MTILCLCQIGYNSIARWKLRAISFESHCSVLRRQIMSSIYAPVHRVGGAHSRVGIDSAQAMSVWRWMEMIPNQSPHADPKAASYVTFSKQHILKLNWKHRRKCDPPSIAHLFSSHCVLLFLFNNSSTWDLLPDSAPESVSHRVIRTECADSSSHYLRS